MTKIATWNVNSLKVRLDQVINWLDKSAVDILALQETKTIDTAFPLEVFKEAGYFISFIGQKTYNGVAIISRKPQENILTEIPGYADPQRRFLTATIDNLRIVNVYIPNGAAVDSEKYLYKLQWLEQFTAWLAREREMQPKLVVLGDFNIAPEDRDVHSPEEWEGSILVSPKEREAFTALLNLNLVDSYRLFPQSDNCYTWWDYRAHSFRRNRGLRIDHLLISTALSEACKAVTIDTNPRTHERPSDHCPVICELESGF